MKRNLLQLLARPVTTYASATLAAALSVCTVTIGMFADDSFLLRALTATLALFTVGFGLFSWFAYVLSTRRSAQERHRNLHDELSRRFVSLEKDCVAFQNTVSEQLSTTHQQHIEEYQKQAYHLQIGLQELRLAALNERESGL